MINQVQFSRQVGDRIPFKALKFLRAVGTSPGILQALIVAGYTQADNDYGWQLLLSIAGYHVKIGTAPTGTDASKAMVELDETDEALLKRGDAVLRRFHPAQADFVFENLSSGSGAEAVLSIATFLARLDALESNPAREATRTEDHAALAALATRGITKEERTRLGVLVKLAQQVASAVPQTEPVDAEQRGKDLQSLRAWYQDWSETARAVIKRRDYLVRLGLSKRKGNKAEPIPVTQPAPVAPVFPAPAAPTTGINGAAGGTVVTPSA